MKMILFFLSTLLLCTDSSAQNGEWTITAGDDVQKVLGDSISFRYPQFMPGTVYLRDGSISNADLNVNLINGEMQFITPSKDTMAIADEGLIKYIVIKPDTFYYNKVFIEFIHGNREAKLGKIEAIKPVNFKKTGAYGHSSAVSSINSASSFYNANSSVARLNEGRQIALYKETVYFIGDAFGKFMPAIKKNIYEMFNTRKTAIETFIKENKIEQDKKEDLVKLVDFIGRK